MDVSVAITGSGGAGVMTAGNLLLEAAAQSGLYGLMVRSSGPQIRGGEAAALVRIASEAISGVDDAFHLLVAIDWENVHRFADEIPLAADALVVGDPDQGEPPEVFRKTTARFEMLAMKKIAKATPGSWPNMIALGLAARLIDLPVDTLKAVVKRSLKKAGPALEASLAAVAAGVEAADRIGAIRRGDPIVPGTGRWLISGNQAAGLGAIRGGVRFVAAYPITPATELLEWLAPALPEVGGTLVQAEDELASINMAIGASFGGVPALTATAGPGLSLMTEAIGLAVAAEVPVVVVDVMRGGPSTGIPAKSEQSDVGIAVNGLHGDAPRIVIAPNSIADCVTATEWATRLAEKLQSPAIVLSDQFMGQARAVVDRPSDVAPEGGRSIAMSPAPDSPAYKRYANTPSGVSPMAIPGTQGCAHTADGLTHNERGIPVSGARDHALQLDKRLRKLDHNDYGDYWADIEGEGDTVVVTFGSCTGAAREAIRRARSAGVHARLMSMRLLAPARPEAFERAIAGAERVLVVEQNHGGQFRKYLRAEYELPHDVRGFNRPGPLPIRPAELVKALVEWRSS